MALVRPSNFGDARTMLEGSLDKRAAVRSYQAALDDLTASLKKNGSGDVRKWERRPASGRGA